MISCASNTLRPFQEIPGPRRLALFGALARQVHFDHDPLRALQELRTTYGDLVRVESPLSNILFMFGPENNDRLYTQTDLFHSRSFILIGPRGSAQKRLRQSIFALNEGAHKRMRHTLLPPFQRSSTVDYREDVVGLIQDTMRSWQAGQQRDLHLDMHGLVWGVVRKLLYGLNEGDASEALHEALEHWLFRTFSPWVRSFPVNLPFTPYWWLLREARKLEQHFLRLMQARRAEGLTGNDALSALLRFKHEDGTPASDEELVGHAQTLYLVAYETTGNTLAWTLFLLAQHPQIQHDLLDELAPYHGAPPSNEDLERLPVLNAVLKESMRILPAVPYSRRFVSRDAEIGAYQVPKATRVVFSNYLTHHSPDIYPEPERFRPERWATFKPGPGEYIPFGAGLRTCIGAALAQFVIRLAVTMIVPRWRINVVPNARIDRKLGISLGPSHGLPVVLARQDRRLQAAPIVGNLREMVDLTHATPTVTVPIRTAA